MYKLGYLKTLEELGKGQVLATDKVLSLHPVKFINWRAWNTYVILSTSPWVYCSKYF